METVKIGSMEYPVLDTVIINGQAIPVLAIPVLAIRMMSDERERELARRKGVTA